MNANINHITRLRINSDGAGVRSVIFTHGCPLNCIWCCNPETHKTDNFKALSAKALYDYISKDIPYFVCSGGGITFSGGEPLLQSDFICEFIKERCKGFSVNIETSLYTDTESLEKPVLLIDEWYVDFKVFDEKKHIEFTGVSNGIIKENLRFLSEKVEKSKILITYPLIPGFNVTDENLYDMMTFLTELGINRVELHPYRKSAETKCEKIGVKPTVIPEVTTELLRTVRKNFLANGFEISEPKNVFGKDKCKYLKAIRKKVCLDNRLPIEIKDCTVKEPCVGTCPQCEYELKCIGEQLSRAAQR